MSRAPLFKKNSSWMLFGFSFLSSAVPTCGKGSPSNFTIPLFCAMEGDDTAEKYTEEKIEIEKIYRGQDLVEVTLQRLLRT